MTAPEHPRHSDDADLRALLEDAVADVEPADRLAAIRTATARRRRRGWLAVGGSAVLAAAVVVAVAVVVERRDDTGRDAVAAQPPTGSPSASSSPPSSARTEFPRSETTTVYYLGDGPDGPDAPAEVLYRSVAPGEPLALLTATPADPDYRTAWPQGSLVSMAVEADRIVVTVAGGPVDDELARQQLLYTVQAAAGEPVPVVLAWDDDRTGPIPDVDRAPELDVLSHLSIGDPAEGATYAGSFVARGRANGFEGTVFCQLLDEAGAAVWEQATVAGGLLDDTLSPWRLRVDLAGVTPGAHTLRCRTDDPTAGAEGRGSDVDTRTVTVE